MASEVKRQPELLRLSPRNRGGTQGAGLGTLSHKTVTLGTSVTCVSHRTGWVPAARKEKSNMPTIPPHEVTLPV